MSSLSAVRFTAGVKFTVWVVETDPPEFDAVIVKVVLSVVKFSIITLPFWRLSVSKSEELVVVAYCVFQYKRILKTEKVC